MTAFSLAIGWDWWLPPNYSVHGHSIDAVFVAIFWLTMFIFVATEAVLVYFMIKYRHKEGRRAIYSHGNTRLEMIWTLIPAVILIVLAVVTKGVWENYRYNAQALNPDRAQILIIGQQFKWNVIYPGPDGKLGRYLLFPKPTDLKWPTLPSGASFDFPKVPGPAYIKEADARRVLNNYIDQINPLGKDFGDPDGKDDDWQNALARPLEIPKGRAVDLNIGSKDVIHDVFLPNFRVKLDAVPGMRGHIVFIAEKSSDEFEKLTRRKYTLDELKPLIAEGNWQIVIGPDSPHASHEKRGHRDWLYRNEKGDTILRNGATIPSAPDDSGLTPLQQLKAIGVNEVDAFHPKYWDLVCEELCGQGHYTMQDKVIVLEDAEYRKKYGGPASVAATGAPAAGSSVATAAAR